MSDSDENEALLGRRSSIHLSNDCSNRSYWITRNSLPVLEGSVLILLFALSLSEVPFKNHIVYEVCTTIFKYSSTNCSVLGTGNETINSKNIETDVQPYAGKIFMVQVLLENVVPAIVALFVGPWSDKFGRKPVIVAAFVGFSSKYILAAIITFASTKYYFSPWLYILAIIPEIILGGNSTFAIGCISYIRDTTNTNERSLRMILYESCIYLGLVIGSFSSSYVLSATNSLIVFSITGITTFILTICLVVFLKESLNVHHESREIKFRSFFQFSSLQEVIGACFKNRPFYYRAIVLLVIVTLGLFSFATKGTNTVIYLFLRNKFSWSIKTYTNFETMFTASQVIGNILGIILLRKFLRFSPIALALLSYGSATLDHVIKLFASESWHLYLSIPFGMLRSLGVPMCFCILTSSVEADETGKVFSFVNAVEYLLPLASTPLFTLVYNKTILFNPSLFFLISSGMFLLCYILITCVQTIKNSSPNLYTSL